MLSRIIPKNTFKLARCFSAVGSEITDIKGLKLRNYIDHTDYTEIFNAVLGADSVNDMTNFLKTADIDDRMLSFSW